MNFLEVESALAENEFEAVGQITTASNGALLLDSKDEQNAIRAIFKPKIGIRQLWDFPNDDLIERELASYLLSKASGANLIPPTIVREIAPYGEGTVQYWIEAARIEAVRIFIPTAIESGFTEVLQANDASGELVSVATLDSDWLSFLALFDAVINNADRKGSHILTDEKKRMWAIDHGVTWHREDKLRTILWANAAEKLSDAQIDFLSSLANALESEFETFEKLLSPEEVTSAFLRLEKIKETGSFPVPSQKWPAIPWPIF